MRLNNCLRSALLLVLALFIMTGPRTQAQLNNSSKWEKQFASQYTAALDIVYKKIDTTTVKLDVYTPKKGNGPFPTLIYFHGGGWVKGTKDSMSGQLTPYLANGWVVVNVGYRLINRAPAPAAVEDTRCAFAWVYENAARYKIDTNKIVLSGGSAGGHLAMITGMLPANSPLDKNCIPGHAMKAAAIVDFYGIADVNDLLVVPNKKSYAVRWLADQKNAAEIASLVSPINYVRKDMPPIIIIHGDADPTVPYSHATRMKAKLDSAGVHAVLYTVPGGQHGKFSKEEMVDIYKAVSAFLKKETGIVFNAQE